MVRRKFFRPPQVYFLKPLAVLVFLFLLSGCMGKTGSLPGASNRPPDSPKLTSAVDHTNMTVLLSWSEPSGSVVGYRLHRFEYVPGSGKLCFAFQCAPLYVELGPGVTSYTDTQVVEGNSYDYYLLAFNDHGESRPSNAVLASPRTYAELSGSITIEEYGLKTTINSASASFKDDKGNVYHADISFGQYHQTAYYSVNVPPGIYRVNQIRVVQAYTGRSASSTFPEWSCELKAGQTSFVSCPKRNFSFMSTP